MPTTAELVERAFEIAAELVQQIGPRPAGSAAEGRARDLAESALRRAGYDVLRTPVSFAPFAPFSPIYSAAGLLLAVSSWLIEAIPWFVILLPLLGVLLPEITFWAIGRRARTAKSENLLAYLGEAGGDPTLVLCAHLDSAPASGFRSAFGLDLQGRWLNIYQRVAFGLAATAALTLLGFTIPTLLTQAIGVIGSAAGAWLCLSEIWRQLARPGTYSPGAVDNASGAGLLIALAERYAHAPPGGLRLGFLFTGAEETGLHGARAFVTKIGPDQEGAFMLLNVDMVGAGDTLRVILSDGLVRKRMTDARLNRLLFEGTPQARGLRAINRRGDFAPFLEAGIPAASIEISGSKTAARAYHTIYDDLSLLDRRALAMAAEAVEKLIAGLARGLENGGGFG